MTLERKKKGVGILDNLPRSKEMLLIRDQWDLFKNGCFRLERRPKKTQGNASTQGRRWSREDFWPLFRWDQIKYQVEQFTSFVTDYPGILLIFPLFGKNSRVPLPPSLILDVRASCLLYAAQVRASYDPNLGESSSLSK